MALNVNVNPVESFINAYSLAQQQQRQKVNDELARQLQGLKIKQAQLDLEDQMHPEKALSQKLQESLAGQSINPLSPIVRMPAGLEGETIATPSAIPSTESELAVQEKAAPSEFQIPSVPQGTPITPVVNPVINQPSGYGTDVNKAIQGLQPKLEYAMALAKDRAKNPRGYAPQVKADANGNLFHIDTINNTAIPVLDANGDQINLGVGQRFLNTSEGIVQVPTKTQGGTGVTPATVKGESGNPLVPSSTANAETKRWDTIVKQANPLLATSRSPIGVVATSDNRANRALITLQKPDLTNEEAHAVISDIAGIYKGGSPTTSEQANLNYKTLYSKIKGIEQYISGKPTGAITPEVRQRLIDTVLDMKRTNKAVIKQNFDAIEKSHPELVSSHQDEWDNLRTQFEEGLSGGLDVLPKSSPSSAKEPVKISTKEEFDAIPSGSSFNFNGRIGIKK